MKDWLKKWTPTIISIIATIIVGYFGIIWSQSQFRKAELERRDRIKDDIVQIIEEHFINEKIIKPTRLSRLIDAKCKNEGVSDKFTSLELFKNAEYNLISSRHIDFLKKEEYKILFDSVYREFRPYYLEEIKRDSSIILKNPELVNQLNTQIRECQTSEAQNTLSLILADYSGEIQRLSTNKEEGKKDRFEAFLETPFGIVTVTVALIAYLMIMFPMIRRIVRRMNELRDLRESREEKYERIKNKLDDLD